MKYAEGLIVRNERSRRLPVPDSVHLGRIWMGAIGLAGIGLIGIADPTWRVVVAGITPLFQLGHAVWAYRRRSASFDIALAIDATAVGLAASVLAIPPLVILGPLLYILLSATVWASPARRWVLLTYGLGATLIVPMVRHLTSPMLLSPTLEAGLDALGVLAALPVLVVIAASIHDAIYARSSAERALADRNRLNTALVEGSPYGIVVVDRSGMIISSNAVFRAMFSHGTHASRLDDLVDLSELSMIDVGAVGVVDARDGARHFPVEVAWSTVADTHPIRVYFVRDVTAREATLRRLHLQESLLDQTQNAVIATDVEGTVISWNRGAETMYGWKEEETLGRRLGEVLVFEQDQAAADEAMEALRRDGRWTGEFAVRHRSGSAVPVLATNSVLTDDHGAMVGFVGVSSDMTEYRQMEREADAAQRLAAKALDVISSPVVVIDSMGRSIASNKAWRRLAGRDEMTSDIVAGLDSGSVADVAHAIAEVASGLVTHAIVESVEVETAWERRWYRIEASAVSTNVMVTFIDITGTVQLSKSLEETVSSQSQLIAEVSHEVKGPLSNLLGLAQTLSSDIPGMDTDGIHEMIAHQATDLAHLFDDLLVVARSRGGQLVLRSQPMELAKEIKAVVSSTAHGRPLDVVIPHPLPAFVGDPLRVRQILRNLLSNAIRYGGERIEVSAVASADQICVTVRDNGQGILADDPEVIFEPYGKGDGGHAHQHSIGLGLHVARELARRMGGDLRYRRKGDWTVFDLALPTGRTAVEVTPGGEAPPGR